MISRRGWVALLVVSGAVGLWLLVAGPSSLFGIDSAAAGTALLMAVAWCALYLFKRAPREGSGIAISPGEWKARIGVFFMALAIAYFLSKIDVLSAAGAWNAPAARAVGGNFVMLLVAWAILSHGIAARWKGLVEEDERDRDIAVRAAGWGRGALVFGIFGLVAMFAFAGEGRLAWATPLVTAYLLVFALLWGSLVEYVASAVLYWRDRR